MPRHSPFSVSGPAESRILAGIHYRSDIDAGRKLATAVADKVIARAKADGSE
jgi:hypothetical protein